MTKKKDLTDYSSIREHCGKTSRITEILIDGFLINFAATRYDLEKNMNLYFDRYRHVLSRFTKEDVNRFKTQYIGHKIFKKGGLLERIIKHPSLKRLSEEEKEYLVSQAEIPWRFCFSEIDSEPAKDFFWMRDVFTDEDFLLFSPGTSQLEKDGKKLLYFHLIGYNGHCWQSFGPIAGYKSFCSGDLLFFASEKNPDIELDEEVPEDVESDPLPYMLLMSGSAYPRTFHQEFEVINLMAEYDSEMPDNAVMKKKFIIEYNKDVYRYSHKKLGGFPHFAHIYHDEKEGNLLFHAMTEYGFYHLVRDFNSLGYSIPEIAYLRVRLQMITTAESILKRKILLNEYEELFRIDPDSVVAARTEKVNKFLELIFPAIREGRDPDVEEAARTAGIDPETAAGIVKAVRQQMAKFDKPGIPEEKEVPTVIQAEQKEVPVRSGDLFSRIYSAAREICGLEPWLDLYENDNFGVKMPRSCVTWFISVMGHSGEYTAIAAYRGYEGFSGFVRMHENQDFSRAFDLFTVPHLLISFTDREALSREDMEAINKSGITFRGKGKWPKIEEVVPAYVPDFPGEETLGELPELLEQALAVLGRAKEQPGLLRRDEERKGEILIRVPSASAEQLQWSDHYEEPDRGFSQVVYTPVWNQKSADAVAKLKPGQLTLQCDLSLMPAPIQLKGKKGYFPFLLLLVDKKGGMIVGTTLLDPLKGLPSLYGSFPQKLLEEILKLGFRPSGVELRSSQLYNLAAEALKQAGCNLILTDRMPLMDEALGGLLDQMGR